jgi:Asp-tRNA(Asn)/Glu-tRNA(Gln) amidotransferase A subunit family amidase
MMKTARGVKTGLMARLDEFESLHKKREPRIHAFVPESERFARIRREATALQRKYSDRTKRPSLYGLLLGVKDIFHVDGFDTHAGSRLPARALRGKEASFVARLRKAGMLIGGKTVTTEFAYFAPGATRNPHNTEHTPGGSSSGSAAAVAAGLVDVALGTQTIGSTIRPAAFCGIVGFKPSYGRIATDGMIPLAPSLDHVGLFAHDMEMISRVSSIAVSHWKATSQVKPSLAIPTGDYLTRASDEMRKHFETIVERLEEAGMQFKRLDLFGDMQPIIERNQTILAAEVAKVHATWYDTYRPLYHQKTAELIEKGFAVPPKAYRNAVDGALTLRRNISAVMDMHGIDAWLSPATVSPAPHGLSSTGDPMMNMPWTQAGMPALTLPSGFTEDGLPLGLQVTADFGRDEDLLTWGATLEAALRKRQ